MEDEEWANLPAEEKCVHKQWKVRVEGYEELTKLFMQIYDGVYDENSPEFEKYLGLVKKFVTDSNAVAQEKGLEATLAYIENYARAGETVSEVMPGIVLKCIAAPKTKTRELALHVILMYVELKKFDAVQEELMKGTEHINPKIVTMCIQAVCAALREFRGEPCIKIVRPKPMIKRVCELLSHSDSAVMQEARMMVVELYKWMGLGPNLKYQLESAKLQPFREFEMVAGQKVYPLRSIRSLQQILAELAASIEEEPIDEDEAPPEVYLHNLASPADILSKLPKDFYKQLEAKEWRKRKEALEALGTLLKNPTKLEDGHYGNLVRALTKVLEKDWKVHCVALAANCITGLANGLKKRFQPYSGALIFSLLEKFKEKKQNVVTAIREAIDATYLTTHLKAILEDVLESLDNKNPTVKKEVSLFLARAFTKTQPAAVNKEILKKLTIALEKNINASEPGVRESSAEALGTLMKLLRPKVVSQFFGDLKKDQLKMAKIEEFREKAKIIWGQKT